MGKLTVAGLEKLTRYNSCEAIADRRRNADAALPLLEAMNGMKEMGRGLVIRRSSDEATILTPRSLPEVSFSSRPWLKGFHRLKPLPMLSFLADGSTLGFSVRGPEADALDAVLPALRINSGINALPSRLDKISSFDSFGLLMRSNARAMNWRTEALEELRIYISVHPPESADTPQELRALAAGKAGREAAIGLLEALGKACDAYAIAYTLHCASRMISVDSSHSVRDLLELGTSHNAA